MDVSAPGIPAAGACADAEGLAAVAAVLIPASARRHPRTAIRALISRASG